MLIGPRCPATACGASQASSTRREVYEGRCVSTGIDPISAATAPMKKLSAAHGDNISSRINFLFWGGWVALHNLWRFLRFRAGSHTHFRKWQ